MKAKMKGLKLPYGILACSFLIILYLVYQASLVDDWDLHRYYEYVDRIPASFSLLDVIQYFFDDGNDFIYYVILYLAKSLGIPYNLITALIVSTFYYLVIKIILDNNRGKIPWYVILVALFSCPIIWILEISRNLTAYVFFYFAFMFYFKNRWKMTLLFIVMAVLTHFSTLMYVPVFIIAWVARNVKLNKWIFVTALILAVVASFYVPDYISRIMEIALEDRDMYYDKYTEMETMNVFSYGNMRYGSISMVLWGVFYSFAILLLSKREGFEFWLLFILTVMLAFFVNSSQMFLNRCMMLMPLFWGLNITNAYVDGNVRKKKTIQLLSLAGFMPLFLFFWGSRDFFLPFIFG